MFSRSTIVATFAVLIVAACGDDAPRGRGTWDVTAGPMTCTSTDTGAATNDDPGTPLVIDLQADSVAVITLTDGASVTGRWTETAGNPDLPLNDPSRQPIISLALPPYDHGGAAWSFQNGFALWSETGDLRVVHPLWQLLSTRTTTVTHSLCTSELVATQR